MFRKACIAAFCIMFLSLYIPVCGDAGSKIKKGNYFYKMKKYDKALDMYNDAQVSSPSSSEIYYNKGNVFYRQKKYKEAFDAYLKAIEKGNVDIEAKALYNSGNALFMQGDLKGALDYYKQALKFTPDDKDIKYNIEYTEKKIKEMLSDSKQTEAQAKKKRAQMAEKGNKQGEKGDGNEKGEKLGQKQKQAANADERYKNGEENEKQGKAIGKKRDEEKKEMSKEEAEKFLSTFERDNKNNLMHPQQSGSAMGSGYNVEKDW